DAVDWPSSKTRTLIEDLLEGRALFGAEGFLPAFGALEPLFAQLPPDAPVVFEEPSAIATAIDEELDRAETALAERLGAPHFPLSAFYVEAAELEGWLRARHTASLMSAPVLGSEPRVLRDATQVDDDTPSLSTFDQ